MSTPLVGAVNAKDAATYLGIGSTLFNDLLNAGEIPATPVGSAKRYRIKDLDAYLERQSKKAS